MHYVITVELDTKPTEKSTDWIVEELAHWHAVAHVAATMTLPAEGIAHAVATAVRLIEPTYRVVSLEVVDEATRDAREGWVPVPELVGATEAAAALGISRAAVNNQIHADRLSRAARRPRVGDPAQRAHGAGDERGRLEVGVGQRVEYSAVRR
ncbi:hypothetical protein DUHN55_14830 [Helicobacter pylori]